MGLFGGGNSSVTSSTTENQFDQKKTVGDNGILLESGSSITNTNTDARDLSDHSSFTDSSVKDSNNTATTNNIDSRDLSDHSTFSDSSQTTYTTNIATLDGTVALGAISAAQAVAGQSRDVLEAALNFGDKVTERATSLASDSADKNRDFASKVVASVFETTKSETAQTTDKLVQAGTVIAGLLSAAFVLGKLLSPKKAKS